MKGKDILYELKMEGFNIFRESERNTFLRDNKGNKIAIPKSDRELHGMLISKIEEKLDIQLFKSIDFKLENIVNQVTQLLKDGVHVKEIKEILSDISTPQESDKLISMAKERIEKSFDMKNDGPEM